MESISVKAFAKVNMYLKVAGKRPDGYHELETLFRGVSLHDLLLLTKGKDGVRLECEGCGIGDLPAHLNLAWQAADLLLRAFPDRMAGAAIRLIKRIPAGAGLGGGSADAAAVLLGLDRLYDLGLEAGELRSLAAQLGSDAAFCLEPAGAVGRGRGEVLEPLTPDELALPLWIVLIKPPFDMSTKEVYGRWKPRLRDEEENSHIADESRLPGLRRGLREKDPASIWENMVNDLEEPAFILENRLNDYKEQIGEEIGGFPGRVRPGGGNAGFSGCKTLLSGSGSTFAVYFIEEEPARLLAAGLEKRLSRMGPPFIAVTRTLTAEDICKRIEGVARTG